MSAHFRRGRQPAEAGQAIAPGQPIKAYSSDFGSFKSPRDCRETAPYQPGDLIWAAIGYDREPRLCLVLSLSVYYTRSGHWIPIYRCLYQTKAGAWSRDFRRVSPGDNYRAHFDDDGDEIELPRVVGGPAQSCVEVTP